MSFGTTPPRYDYLGTGLLADYDFGFKVYEAANLSVVKRDTLGVETTLVYLTDYTIPVGDFNNENGGTITLTAGNLPTGYTLTIRWGGASKQDSDIRNQGGLFLESLEDAIDKVCRYVQGTEDLVRRSLHLPESELGTADNTQLPSLVQRANRYLTFDSSGNPQATDGQAASGTSVLATGSTTSRLLADRFADEVNARDHGIVLDGNTDNLTAWNALIAKLNLGTVTNIYIPAGTMLLSGEPDTITASDWSIHGAGGNATLLKMATAAGTAGTFFRLGSASVQVQNARIHDFALQTANYATLDGTKLLFDIFNTNDVWIDHIYADKTGGVAGFAKLGDTASGSYGKYATRTTFSHIQILHRTVLEAPCFDLQQANVTRAFLVTASLVTLSVTGACKAIYIHPVGADADGSRRTCDSGVWHGCEFNYNLDSNNVDHMLVVDGSQGIPVNHWFTDCVFDHCKTNAIKFLVSAGAAGGARIAEFYFNNCHVLMGTSSMPGGGAILIDNTGNRDICQIFFNGGTYAAETTAAVQILNGTTQLIDVSFVGVIFMDSEMTTPKAALDIGVGVRNLTVVGCRAQARLATQTCTFTYLVNCLAEVERFTITNNICYECAVGDVNTGGFLDGTLPSQRYIEHNVALANFQPHALTTTNATLTNFLVHPLLDETTVHVRAVVTGIKSDGTDRASYELAGTFYRTAAGNATLVGTVTRLHEAESNPAWDCVLVAVSTNAVVRVTGVAATTIKWAGTMTTKSVLE